MSENTTAVATAPKPPTALEVFRNMFEVQKEAIRQILPRTLTPERMIKLMIVAASRNPKLMECSKESVLMSFMQCVELGLEPNSPLGLAYIIPYYNSKTKKTEAQFQLGYKGLLALIRRSNEVTSVNAYVVHANDEFDISLGDDAHITHKPTVNGDPGPIIGAYMVATLKDGQTEREWMTHAEIMKIKAGSQAVKAGKQFGFQTPWDTAEGEMCRKTVLKRGGKRLPISVEVAEIIERENGMDYGSMDNLPKLPEMPQERAIGEGSGDQQAEPEPPPTETGRTVEDEVREIGEALGKPSVEVEALIKQHQKKGTLDSLRDQFALDLKRKQAEG